MDSGSSNRRARRGLQLASRVMVPTGPRSMVPLRNPRIPIRKNNQTMPSVLDQTPVTKMTYEEAINDILEQTGPFITKLTTMPAILTSVVLYNPRGGVLKASEGLLLQNDVSLCYLITWLQIFTDNCVAKYHSKDELVVKSVEIRFHNKKLSKTYPDLEGEVCYSAVDGIILASVNWPSDNSMMELYWEAYRSMMQLGSDEQIKYPILKVKTAKFLVGARDSAGARKGLGGGHKFAVGKEKMDVSQYFDHQGQQIPDALRQLDQVLTASADRQLSRLVADQQHIQSSQDAPVPVQKVGDQSVGGDDGEGRLNFGGPEIDQVMETNPKTHNTKVESHSVSVLLTKTEAEHTTKATNSPHSVGKENEIPTISVIRQPPSKVVSLDIGNHRVDISVPFRPPIHPDPKKTWRRFQRSGGIPQIHNAFPLDHLVYDPKDMPDAHPHWQDISDSDIEDRSYIEEGSADSHKVLEDDSKRQKKYQGTNNNDSKVKNSDIHGSSRLHESAVGFSSDDDDIFFPVGSKASTRPADTNPAPKSTHRHYHRTSENNSEGMEKEHSAEWEVYDSLPRSDFIVVHTPSPGRLELPDKKLASAMNVNAPEFVAPTTANAPTSDPDLTMNPYPSGSSRYIAPPGVGFNAMMHLNALPFIGPDASPFAGLHATPFMMPAGQFLPYHVAYPPTFLAEPNFWPPPYTPNFGLRSGPVAAPLRSSFTGNNSWNHLDAYISRAEESDMLPAAEEEFNRQAAEHTCSILKGATDEEYEHLEQT